MQNAIRYSEICFAFWIILFQICNFSKYNNYLIVLLMRKFITAEILYVSIYSVLLGLQV